jgi:hypothetical protein
MVIRYVGYGCNEATRRDAAVDRPAWNGHEARLRRTLGRRANRRHSLFYSRMKCGHGCALSMSSARLARTTAQAENGDAVGTTYIHG